MAKQTGILPLKGTIDNLTFADTENGSLVRKKTRLNKKAMDANPKFDKMRRYNLEFTHASKSAKLLYTALTVVTDGADNKAFLRLRSEMRRCIAADGVNPLGQRNISDGGPELLEGFEINRSADLSRVFKGDFTTTVDRAGDTAALTIADFGLKRLVCPPAASQYRFVFGAAAVDFSTGKFICGQMLSSYQAVGTAGANGVTLTASLPALGDEPVFLMLGVEFFEEMNGEIMQIHEPAFNAIRIVKVDV